MTSSATGRNPWSKACRRKRSFTEMMQADRERFNRFFHKMLKRGAYLAPSAYEAGFVSAAHGTAEIEETVTAARAAFAILK